MDRDEQTQQAQGDASARVPQRPAYRRHTTTNLERNGVSSLFMLFAPLDGWRRVEVRERRTKVDWAHVIKKLVDEDYPDRDRIVLVMDSISTLTSCPRYTRHSSLLRRGV